MKLYLISLAAVFMFANIGHAQDRLGLIPEINGDNDDPFAEEFLNAFMESALVVDDDKEAELDLAEYL